MKEVPSSIDRLEEELTQLNLKWYRDIKQLPTTIGNLHRLETINLEGCRSLESLP